MEADARAIGQGQATAGVAAAEQATLVRSLRAVLALQVVLGLVWGISMLFFASAITLGDRSGPHIEKIALEGGAHFALVLGAILVWRTPSRESRDLLRVMIFLNALWAVTDFVYIPLYSLTAIDFLVKVVVNALLAIGLAITGRRAGIV